MLKRFAIALLLLTAAFSTRAHEYTDVYYDTAEPGWGAFLVQSDTSEFIAFFIYGSDGKPTWYTAQLTLDASGNYTGGLYATTGTFYGSAWNTQQLTVAPVGNASFQPTSPTTAKLVYTVTTPAAMAASVTRNIQRQTLTAIPIAGSYTGGQNGIYTGCTDPSFNAKYAYFYQLQVVQSGTTATLNYMYDDGLQCSLSGTLSQTGALMSIANATYTCVTGLSTTANVTELRRTSLGLEGRFSAANVLGSCREDAVFGGPAR
jgi:hypothetical protein